MNPTRLAEINKNKSDAQLSAQRHNAVLQSSANVQETILTSTSALIRYLEGHTTKTEVVNQLNSISTPDVKYVVEALQILDNTIKARKETDLSEITAVMQSILDEAKLIPKELPKETKQKFVDYSDQLKALKKAIDGVTEVVKQQELIAEAPVVNVDAPVINVDAPNLTPLQTSIKDVVKAVKGIVIPEYKTDNKNVEKLLTASNKLLKGILEKPISSGGGGSLATPYVDASGIPAFPQLTADGKISVDAGAITVTSGYYAKKIVVVGSITYIGIAAPGSSQSDPLWQVQKIDESVPGTTDIVWADGNANFDNDVTDMTLLSYS